MTAPLLTPALIEQVLARAASLRVAVVGDLFLDRYLDLDAALSEPSIETGLDAYQVVSVRPCPGAAGTVLNNLVALGVRALPVAVIGDDGEGHELRQALAALGVDTSGLVISPRRRTPTYTKPMLMEAGQPPRELNRLDIHPRTPLPEEDERALLALIDRTLPTVDAVAVLDQVSRPECGVITTRVRERIPGLAVPALADSRERIGLFVDVMLKPNERECRAAVPEAATVEDAARALAARAGRPVFCTRAEAGILIAEPGGGLTAVPGYRVDGPTDPVGAGDSTTAGILCALGAGLSPAQAAAFGCLVASITVQQLGTTGTAPPARVRQRIAEVEKIRDGA